MSIHPAAALTVAPAVGVTPEQEMKAGSQYCFTHAVQLGVLPLTHLKRQLVLVHPPRVPKHPAHPALYLNAKVAGCERGLHDVVRKCDN